MGKMKGENWTARLYVGTKMLKEYDVQSIAHKNLSKAEMSGRCGTKEKFLDYSLGGHELTITFDQQVPQEIEDLVDTLEEAERNNLEYPLIGVASIKTARGSSRPASKYLYSPGLLENEDSTGGPDQPISNRIRFIATKRKKM